MPAGAEGFEPGRLTMAREARCLRKRELAQRLGRPETTISKWEKDVQRPEPSAIPELAEALSVEPNWFFKPLDRDQRAVFNRSLMSELALMRDRAKARLGFVEAIEQTLGEYIDLPAVDVPDVLGSTDFRDLRSDDIEEIASDLRAHWDLPDGPLADILLVMENAGIVVAEDDIGSVKLDGVSWWSSRTQRPYVLLARDKKSGVRRRFDSAHELAHVVLHRQVSPEQLVEHFSLIEDQAMVLAGALLMPADDFKNSVYSVSLDGLLNVKEEWGVSVGAMIKRLANLGEIAPQNERRLWQYYSARRWRSREPLDDKIEIERPENLRTSIEMLVEEDGITPSALLREIGLDASDVTTLCGLAEDFFEPRRENPKRARPALRIVKDSDGPEPETPIIPFRRRRD